MNLRSGAPVAALTAALALIPTGSASAGSCSIHGQEKSFGPTYVTSLRVSGTSCRRGKQVVRAFHGLVIAFQGHDMGRNLGGVRHAGADDEADAEYGIQRYQRLGRTQLVGEGPQGRQLVGVQGAADEASDRAHVPPADLPLDAPALRGQADRHTARVPLDRSARLASGLPRRVRGLLGGRPRRRTPGGPRPDCGRIAAGVQPEEIGA